MNRVPDVTGWLEEESVDKELGEKPSGDPVEVGLLGDVVGEKPSGDEAAEELLDDVVDEESLDDELDEESLCDQASGAHIRTRVTNIAPSCRLMSTSMPTLNPGRPAMPVFGRAGGSRIREQPECHAAAARCSAPCSCL